MFYRHFAGLILFSFVLSFSLPSSFAVAILGYTNFNFVSRLRAEVIKLPCILNARSLYPVKPHQAERDEFAVATREGPGSLECGYRLIMAVQQR